MRMDPPKGPPNFALLHKPEASKGNCNANFFSFSHFQFPSSPHPTNPASGKSQTHFFSSPLPSLMTTPKPQTRVFDPKLEMQLEL